MKIRMVIFLSVLVILAMACNLMTPTGKTPQAPGNTPQSNESQPGGVLQPAGTPNPQPININEGLSSLNSYQMTIEINSSGPDPTQSSTLTIESQHSQDQDAYYNKINNSVVDVGGEKPNTSETETYQIGNDLCTISGDDPSWTSMAPNEAEMLGLFKSMLGFTPLTNTPTFVAQETVNGIPSNHFTFKVPGLGVKSGAEVKANQGDYWLAVDGQYIVKYLLVVETSMSDSSEVLHEEISIELNQINQPIGIEFPQGCLDASKVTPTP